MGPWQNLCSKYRKMVLYRTRKNKRGGAHHKPKSFKKLRLASLKPKTFLKKKNMPISAANLASMFAEEHNAPEENLYDPEFSTKVIQRFNEFLTDLLEKDEDLWTYNNAEVRSDIDILKLNVASTLIEAFGKKAKLAPKTQNATAKAFNDDLSSLLGKMSL